MCGSLWKCSQLQCKLATTEESRGLEVQNQLLVDMKTEFQEFPGRRVYTDVEREGILPKDVDHPSAAPRVVEEEEDRTTALLPTVPILTSPPPSIPEIDSESQVFERHFKARLQHHLFFTVFPVLSAQIALFRRVSSLQRTLAAEAQKQVQPIENENQLKDNQQDPEDNSPEERIERKTLCNQAQIFCMKLLMSPRCNVLGWRIQPVLFVGLKQMNLDTGPLSLFQRQRRSVMRQTLRYCGNSRLMITSGKTRASQSVFSMRSGATFLRTRLTISLRM